MLYCLGCFERFWDQLTAIYSNHKFPVNICNTSGLNNSSRYVMTQEYGPGSSIATLK